MIKLLLSMAFVFIHGMGGCSMAFASGKLMIEPRVNARTEKVNYVVGLSIYEKLMPGVFYNSWSGLGDALEYGDTTYNSWYTTKHQLDFKVFNWILSPGVRASYSTAYGDFSDNHINYEGFGRLSIPLW